MNARKLALISALAFGLAFSGGAFAQDKDQQADAHHPDEGAATSPDSSTPAPAVGDDEAAAEAMQMDGTNTMMCGRMMAMMGEMMKGGGAHPPQGGMKGHDMHGMMKGHSGMMGGDEAGKHGKAGMARHGFARLLTADEVTKKLAALIANNKRLKIGKLEPGGDFSFAAEITTADGSLVHKLMIDRRDGQTWEVD